MLLLGVRPPLLSHQAIVVFSIRSALPAITEMGQYRMVRTGNATILNRFWMDDSDCWEPAFPSQRHLLLGNWNCLSASLFQVGKSRLL